MKDKPESKKAARDAERIVCANPRYGNLTIAQATRRIMQGERKAKEPGK